MGSSSGETIVLAQLSPGSCPLLSPAPHFHYSMRGLSCPLTGAFALGSCQAQQKGVIFAGVCSGTVAAQPFLSPDFFLRHTCALKRRESPHFQKRPTKLCEHLAPKTSGQEVRASTRRTEQYWRLSSECLISPSLPSCTRMLLGALSCVWHPKHALPRTGTIQLHEQHQDVE